MAIPGEYCGSGVLQVQVISARELYNTETLGTMDPYVKLQLDNNKKKVQTTKVHKDGGLTPKWDEQLTFDYEGESQLIIEIWDREHLSSDDLIGHIAFPLRDVLATRGGFEGELSIHRGKKQKFAGRVKLKILLHGGEFYKAGKKPAVSQPTQAAAPVVQAAAPPAAQAYAPPPMQQMAPPPMQQTAPPPMQQMAPPPMQQTAPNPYMQPSPVVVEVVQSPQFPQQPQQPPMWAPPTQQYPPPMATYGPPPPYAPGFQAPPQYPPMQHPQHPHHAYPGGYPYGAPPTNVVVNAGHSKKDKKHKDKKYKKYKVKRSGSSSSSSS